MKYIIILLTFSALIISCNTGKKTSLLSNPDDIIADQYVINIDKDTTLVTKNGALLKIPKGSLSIDNGNSVTLEIKEAYSIDQMILAGLTTQSNGDPLSSGGMIYINAAAGQNATIRQAIKVAIPATYLTENMSLYKGKRNEDGTINWTDPQPLPENKKITMIEQGQQLFQSKCQSCHAIGKDGTGPDLANLLKRPFIGKAGGYPDFHFAQEWTHSQMRFAGVTQDFFHYEASAAYHCNVAKLFGTAPTAFPGLTRDDLLTIANYIQNESSRNNLPFPSHAFLDSCIDSCRIYKEKIDDLQHRKKTIDQKRQDFIEDNGEMVEVTPDSEWLQGGNAPVDFEERVSPENYGAMYYQFTIESFGWNNIDMLLNEANGASESELFVRIVGEYRERVNVFLIIPSGKVYGEGGPTGRNPDEYAFFYKTGKLPLPQNVKAYIMAVTENESSIAFALKEFITGLKQQFDISLQASTKEQFRSAIQNLNLDRLHIGVKDSKNAKAIRKADSMVKNIDSEIKKAEGLKPKNCDCDCELQKPGIDSATSIEYVYDISNATSLTGRTFQ